MMMMVAPVVVEQQQALWTVAEVHRFENQPDIVNLENLAMQFMISPAPVTQDRVLSFFRRAVGIDQFLCNLAINARVLLAKHRVATGPIYIEGHALRVKTTRLSSVRVVIWRELLNLVDYPAEDVLVNAKGVEKVVFKTMDDVHRFFGSVACIRNFYALNQENVEYINTTAFHAPIYSIRHHSFTALTNVVRVQVDYDGGAVNVGEFVFVREGDMKIGGNVASVVGEGQTALYTVDCVSGTGEQHAVTVPRDLITRRYTEFSNTERAARSLQLHALELPLGAFVRVIRVVSIGNVPYFVAVKLARVNDFTGPINGVSVESHTLFEGVNGLLRVRGRIGMLPAKNIGVVAPHLMPFLQWRPGSKYPVQTRGVATHPENIRYGCISFHSRVSVIGSDHHTVQN